MSGHSSDCLCTACCTARLRELERSEGCRYLPSRNLPSAPALAHSNYMCGRITKYSDELWSTICQRLSLGETLIAICKTPDYPAVSTVWSWLQGDKGYDTLTPDEAAKKLQHIRETYERAREIQADYWADECVNIADDSSNDIVRIDTVDKEGNPRVETRVSHAGANRSRLRIETRQWLMTRRNKKYVELTKSEVTGKDGAPLIAGIDAPRAETREEWLARKKAELEAE